MGGLGIGTDVCGRGFAAARFGMVDIDVLEGWAVDVGGRDGSRWARGCSAVGSDSGGILVGTGSKGTTDGRGGRYIAGGDS